MTVQPELFDVAQPDPEARSLEEERRAREEEAKRDVLRRMRQERMRWITAMREEMAKTYLYRVKTWDQPYVTADDARNLMRAYPHRFALPAGASMNTLGSLFGGKDWEPVDTDDQGRSIPTHVSSTDGSRGNRLIRWRYVGEEWSRVA